MPHVYPIVKMLSTNSLRQIAEQYPEVALKISKEMEQVTVIRQAHTLSPDMDSWDEADIKRYEYYNKMMRSNRGVCRKR